MSRSQIGLAKTIGRRIRELRQERGWGQVELAAALDIDIQRATISDFETGRRLPSLRTLEELAKAFEVHPVALVLSPQSELRARVALAALDCPEATLRHVAKLLDVS